MANPSFVGASTVYNATTDWPSSLTFNTADLPAGSAVGDRVILYVTSYYSQDRTPSPGPKLDQFAGLTGWDFVGTAGFTTTGGSVFTYTEIRAWTTRRTTSTFPITIDPQTSTGAAFTPEASLGQRFYRAAVAVYSPSAGFRSAAVGLDGQSNNDDFSPSDSVSVVGVGSGTFVQANFVGFADIGAVSTANGYTVRHTQATITGRGGSLTISDKAFSTGGSSSYIVFDKPSGNYGGVINFALDVADPPLSSGWSVGRIKY